METWITDERLEKSGCVTREILANEVGISVETQRRWGKSESKEERIYFDKYAELFKEDEKTLRNDYRRVRRANGNMFSSLDEDTKTNLKDAIAACQAQQVLIKTKNCKVQAPEKLHSIIIDALEKGAMQEITNECNATLTKDIKSASQKQLEVLRSFISEVAKASMHVDESMLNGGSHTLVGRAPAWLIRLMIDSANQLDFYEEITVKNDSLDNDSVPHLMLSGKAVGDDKDGVTHALICALNKKFRPTVSDPPCYKEEPIAYDNYCGELNAFFFQSNPDSDTRFAIANKNDVYDLLLSKCADLRIYEIEETRQESGHSCFDDHLLGGWLARYLGAIIERKNEFMERSNAPEPSTETSNKKEREMTNVNVKIVNKPHVENKPKFTQTNTQTNSPEWQQFQQDFEALTKNVQQNIERPEYRDLKNTVRDIQEHIETTGTLPKDSKSWLEKSLAVISNTDAAWGLTEKTIKAITLLTSAGIA